jgi:GntR family transcriptional regulator/MocR family aminotransferase
MEDPCFVYHRHIVRHAGLEPVPVPVDDGGMRIDILARSGADVALVTPAHQSPTGVVLAPERRTALVAWAEEHDAIVIEDDYDAEHRYDRDPVGALQGLAPERVVYGGTASKTLAPALRLGWLVVPQRMVESIRREKYLADQGTARIEQHAFADFIARGELDRHLRRMRSRYRARRDALVTALERELPEARVKGIAAGLHVTVELPPGHDEQAIKAAAHQASIRFSVLGDYDASGPPTLMLGYGALAEAAIGAGVRELARIVRET